MGGPGGCPGSHFYPHALLSSTDELVGFLVYIGLLHGLLLRKELDEGRRHGVAVPVLLKEVGWALASELFTVVIV